MGLDADDSDTVAFEAAVEPADGIPGYGVQITVGAITLALALLAARFSRRD
ncbi:hypothetical protein [Natrarchaeobaculum aegyptiacum]|uniref:hypothetical protein n=1 Tax=Natrarchaeobaculum aegyptiacum TaxID=745377 RepID=UPI0013747EDA|nr:hypothetical protein [Natrarchaeobaculum aegyptiacum]